jgi:hypothetical protein
VRETGGTGRRPSTFLPIRRQLVFFPPINVGRISFLSISGKLATFCPIRRRLVSIPPISDQSASFHSIRDQLRTSLYKASGEPVSTCTEYLGYIVDSENIISSFLLLIKKHTQKDFYLSKFWLNHERNISYGFLFYVTCII